MHYPGYLLFALAVILAPFAALAQVPDPGTDLAGFIGAVLSDVQSGQYRAVAVLAVIGAVYVARKFASPTNFLRFFLGDRGGAVLSLVAGLLAQVGPLLLAKGPITFSSILGAVIAGAAPAGYFVLVKRIVAPADQKPNAPVVPIGSPPAA